MSIRTNKMLTARSRVYGNPCKMFFPCNEGSGNTITDLIAGVAVSDATTATHSVPHAISILSASGVTGTGITNLQIPKVGMVMSVLKAHAITALSYITLGNSANTGILMTSISNALAANGNVEANTPVTVPASGDYVIHAVAWNATHGYCYFDAAATKAALAVTLEASSAITAGTTAALPRTFTDELTLSSVNKIDLFGIALFDFGTALPSDLLTGIQTMAANWLNGEKTLYAPWADR